MYTKIRQLYELPDVKVRRDALLRESDAMMIEDRPSDKDAWRRYRQDLRDLPESIGWPDNVEWPQKPE